MNTNTNSTLKINFYAKSIECWSGPYYIHAFFSLLISFLFVGISLVVQMTYYETKYSISNITAKSNSKSEVFVLFSKIIILICFIFFEEITNQWILIVILFFLSGLIFLFYYEEKPFYSNQIMQVKIFNLN